MKKSIAAKKCTIHFCFCGFIVYDGTCCDMGQNDTIGKIELNPSFLLSSDNTNYKNDIQLFPQLFDELRVITINTYRC